MSQWTGILNLDLEERHGKTVARNVYFQGAFKVMRPVYHDDSGQVCYYLLNPGGGYLDGDRYRMQISADEGAKVTLTTQSATKVYKSPKDHAYQETEIHLKKNSYLEYVPDPLIAYENAYYKQKNIVHMEKGSTFLYTDIVTPGWSPSGERFTYKTIQLLTEIYYGGLLGVLDHIKLTPGTQNITEIGYLEGCSHLGSMIVVSEFMTDALLDELYETIQAEKNSTFTFGLSRLEVPGFSLRLLANSTQQIEHIFSICHRIITETWYNRTPRPLRKY